MVTGAQQTTMLFNSPVAVYGRWILAGTFVVVFCLCLFKDGLRLRIGKLWLVLIHVWVGWQILLVLYHQQTASAIFEYRAANLMLLLAGMGFLASRRSQKRALITLNQSYFLLNSLLVAGSLIYLGGFNILGIGRFEGIFRNPNYLSWVTANVILTIFILLVYSKQGREKAISYGLWLLVLILATALLIAAKTRGAIISIILSLSLYFLSYGVKKLVVFIVFISSLLVILVMGFRDETISILRFPYDPETRSVDIARLTSGRSTILELSLSELHDNPERLLIGSGDRGYRELSKRRPADWHDPIALLHSDGIFGFFVYWLFLSLLVFDTFKKTRRHGQLDNDGAWAYPLTLVLLAKMILGSIGDSILIVGHMDHLYFWVCAGILIASYPKNTKMSETSPLNDTQIMDDESDSARKLIRSSQS